MKYLTITDGENVALKTIVACIAFSLLILTACICMLCNRTVDATFLWPIIAVISAFAGIGSFDFSQFRKTDYGAIERQGDADAKVAAATKAVPASPVVQPIGPAVEIHS